MSILADLRYAVRLLVRVPGFTASAVLTLALGIGACAAIFSVVDGVPLRPLPYARSDRLVAIQETLLPQLPEFAVSPRHYSAWKEQTTSFESLAAFQAGSYSFTGSGEPIRVSAWRVTASAFSVLRAHPALGRVFSAEEDRPGQDNVVVLSHGFWRRQMGGSGQVIGQSIELDGRRFTIVGVMPSGFQIDTPADVFTPAAYGPSDVHELRVVARLKDGVSLDHARSEMTVVVERQTELAQGR